MIIRSRSLETSTDLCCLPSPYRITYSVAGMAFNFSKVELDRPATRRPAAAYPEPQRPQHASGRSRNPMSCFGIPQYSPAT